MERFGPGAVDQVCSGLAPGPAEILRTAAGFGWYPLVDVVQIEKRVVDVFYGGRLEEAYQLGEYHMRESVSRVYRFLLRFLDTPSILLRTPKLWGSFMDQGAAVLEQPAPRHVILTLQGFNPVHKVHCQELRGALAGGLNLCGAKETRLTHPACCLDGAPACRFEAEWK